MGQASQIQHNTVANARKGDRAAHALLYDQYSKAMYNICIRMTANADDAADILQDAFIQAFEKLAQLKTDEAFGGWLKQIVLRLCIRFSQKTIRWSKTETEELKSSTDAAEAWWMDIPLPLVHQQIKALPSGCRQVFVLFALEDLSHKQIAIELDISESTSKSQYQRARSLLRTRLTEQMEKHG